MMTTAVWQDLGDRLEQNLLSWRWGGYKLAEGDLEEILTVKRLKEEPDAEKFDYV